MLLRQLLAIAQLLVGWTLVAVAAQRIPQHLIHCYRTPNATASDDAGNTTLTRPPSNLPFTLHLFIELLRKIEDANPTSLDMRLHSANLLHRLRLDGIERAAGISQTEHITPYRANGIQTAKFQLLLQLISDSAARLDFAEWLRPAELCHLHRMLSASVEPWERGDEWRTCPLVRQPPGASRIAPPWLKRNHVQDPLGGSAVSTTEERMSRCPLEGGVVRTAAYGSIAVGTVVAALAAGLQPQRVPVSEFVRTARDQVETVFDEAVVDGEDYYGDTGGLSMERERREAAVEESDTYARMLSSAATLDNTYAAGVAGDLAEVCVYQAPYVGERVQVGLAGVWNNTLYPRVRHFPDASAGRWELTDAEALAGIDALFLAQQVAQWQRKVRRLRLSQVVDMYYSNRGVPVVGIKLAPQPGGSFGGGEAANRNNPLITKRFSTRDDLTSACDRRKVLQLIDREALQLETLQLAQVLQYRRQGIGVDAAALRRSCAAAVDRFMELGRALVDRLPACNRVKEFAARPVVDLTLVLDGARSEFESVELVSWLVEAIDVSNHGSWISIIHGQTGRYMVHRTRSVSSVFEQLQNCSGDFPTGLSISAALQRLSATLVNQTRSERQSATVGAESPVLLVLAQKQRITQRDFDAARAMLADSMLQFPDLYYAFVTNSPDQIKEMIGPATATGHRAANQHYKIIETRSLAPPTFATELGKHLNAIPKRIVVPFCRNDSRTEYTSNGGGTTVRQAFFEDYISPYQEHGYRIAPQLLENRDEEAGPVRVKFHVNYGTMSVCMAREVSRTRMLCHSIGEADTAAFELERPCDVGVPSNRDAGGACRPVYFFVQLDESELRCTENQCRYPDQVLMIVKHEGLRCERDDRSAAVGLAGKWVAVAVMSLLVAIWG